MAPGLRLLLTTLLLCAAGMAAAESLPDPTRPAIDLGGGAGGVAATAEAETAARGLQTIIISPQYRAAIINGATVRLGGRIGDSTLIEVRESSVVLQSAHGRRVLELFPKVSIKKNEAGTENRAQEKALSQPALPEEDAGETK